MILESLRFEGRRLLRNFPTMFFTLAFPVMLLVIFGSVYGNEPSDVFNGLGTVDASVPAYISLVIAVTGLMSFPLTMAEYRDKGVLRRLQMTPASPVVLLLAQLVVNVVLSFVGIALLVLVGVFAFGLNAPFNPVLLLPVLILSVVSIFSIGFLVASWAPNERSATLVANLLYFPMIFLSGASIPAELLPPAVQTASKVLPLTWAVELLRGAWIEDAAANWTVGIAVLGGTFVICSALSVRFFRWD